MSEENSKSNELRERLITLAEDNNIDLGNDEEVDKLLSGEVFNNQLPEEVHELISKLIIQFYKIREKW